MGAILRAPDGQIIKRKSLAIGIATNNEAEYRGVIEGLRLAKEASAQHLLIRSDSKLIVNQVRGVWKVAKPELKPLRAQVLRLLEGFESWEIQHVPRSQNAEADVLADAALGVGSEADRVLNTIVARYPGQCGKCSRPVKKGAPLSRAQIAGCKAWICSVCADAIMESAI